MKRCSSSVLQVTRKTQSRRLRLAAIALGLGAGTFFATSEALSQNIWNSPTNGTWSDSSKWTPNVVPDGIAIDALIEQAGTYVVTLNDSRSINNLTLNSANATLSHTSGTLSLHGAISVAAGRYELNGGTIAGGSLDGTGLAYSSGSLNGVAVTGGLTLSEPNGSVKLSGGTTVAGNIAVENYSTLYADAFNLTNQSLTLGEVGGATSGSLYVGSGGMTVDSTSSITFQSGNIYVAGALANDGLLLADGALGGSMYNYGGAFSNTGTVTSINGADLGISTNNTTNTGTMSASAGSSLNLGGVWSNVGGTISVDGTSTLNLGGSFDTANLGTLNITSGGTVNITGTQANTGSAFAGGEGWRLNGGTITGGSLDGTGLAYSSGTLAGVAVTGGLTLSEANGSVTLSGGSTVVDDIAVENYSTLYADAFNLTNQSLTLGEVGGATSGSLYVGSGGMTVDSTSSITFQSGNINVAGALANDGLLLADGALGGSMYNYGGAFSNTGTVTSINGADLGISTNNTTNTGTMSALAGSNLNLGGVWSNVGGTISVDGTSTLNLGGSFDTANLGTLNITSGGTVNITGTQANTGSAFAGGEGWRLNGGTITGGSLDGTGLAYSSGTLAGVAVTGGLTLSEANGSVTLSGGSTVVDDIAVENYSTLYADAFNLTNQSLTLGEVGGATSGSLYVGSGGMTVDSTSSITFQSGNIYVAGALANDGLLLADGAFGGSMYNYGGAFSNTGTVTSINGADLGISTNNTTNTGTMSASAGSNLNLGGVWSNLDGTISVDGTSTLNLGGSFDTANLGTLNVTSGGTVNITGTQANAGSVFAGGEGWRLYGGTIAGGSLDGNGLAYSSGSLAGVAVTGGLTLSEANGSVTLSGGSTVVDDIAVENYSTLYADAFNLTNQSLTLGEVGGATSGSLYVGSGGMTVDSTSSITFQSGNIYVAGALANDGLLLADGALGGSMYNYGGAFSNTGTVISINGADLGISTNNTTNTGTMSASAGSSLNLGGVWSNVGGTISVDGTSTLNLGGSYDTANLGTLNVTPGGTVNITGTQANTGSSFAGGEGWRLYGGTITGGTLDGSGLAYSSGTLDGVAVTGGMTLSEPNGSATLSGGTTVAGDVAIQNSSTLYVDQALTFSGQTVMLDSSGGIGTGTIYSYTDNLTFASDSMLTGNGSVYAYGHDVFLDGVISPGFSPGSLILDGDGEFILGSTAMLNIELGGVNPGEFDTITANQLTLGGTLNVSLLSGFTLADGMTFDFLTVRNPLSGGGMFAGLADMDTVANFGAYNLQIAYGAGDGNDVRLFAVSAVPEPSSIALLVLGSFAGVVSYRRRQQKRAQA
ncbi:hypothetical protein K227x_41480 [Rubripirellula lacrimiformis]|uniref:Ice-binding protein C-terminal domain-containing protein n=1 Tax=Rubripirellula lacrimiformis TaxID=1930273 RepID=A0A517NF63_9BACT|nr:PEP-CTERM sorting domain-containing protein [Rubripirellula lacrimiformis]QDT05745.1 hypothetical protein K227x_41480 [Rubripirellula lacrimiformis]